MESIGDTLYSGEELIGEILAGVYSLESVIASGSTSVVYIATNRRLDQKVAVKVLSGDLVKQETLMKRFEVEAKIQAKLTHPHIVRVFDFVSDHGRHAIVMELVDGDPLDQLLFDLSIPMNIERIKKIALPILDAVGYAHDHGIIHRDIKPSNIIISSTNLGEFPRIMDFGIAKAKANTTPSSTIPGAMLGTLLYMSPEQCKALPQIDQRSDIYSLGITLYQMATGMVPFYADSAFEIMLAHVQTPPTPPKEFVPNLPDKLQDLILRAISKSPDDRFASTTEMQKALEEIVVPTRRSSRSQGLKDNDSGPIRSRFKDVQIPSLDAALGVSKPFVRKENLPTRRITDDSTNESQGSIQEVSTEPNLKNKPVIKEVRTLGGRIERPFVRQATIEHQRTVVRHKSRPIKAVTSSMHAYDSGHFPSTTVRLRLRIEKKNDWSHYFHSNVSGGGLFCPTNSPPDVGTPVRIEVAFAEGPKIFVRGTATWRRTKLNDPRTRAGVGVQLHASENNKIDYLRAWVEGKVDEKRGLRRLPLKLRTSYEGEKGRHINFTHDLNEEGLFLRSRELLKPQTKIEITIFAPGEKKGLPLDGIVSRVVEDQHLRGMGIKLIFDDPAKEIVYNGFIEDLERDFLSGDLSDEAIA